MSTSQRSLEQVRSILGKLDRDIDAARAKRLGSPVPPQPPAEPTNTEPTPPLPAITPPTPPPIEPAPFEHDPNDPGRSGYGKARPVRRNS